MRCRALKLAHLNGMQPLTISCLKSYMRVLVLLIKFLNSSKIFDKRNDLHFFHIDNKTVHKCLSLNITIYNVVKSFQSATNWPKLNQNPPKKWTDAPWIAAHWTLFDHSRVVHVRPFFPLPAGHPDSSSKVPKTRGRRHDTSTRHVLLLDNERTLLLCKLPVTPLTQQFA